MTRNEVRDLYIATLREFLGKEAPEDISEATDQFADLGRCSEDGVEFACELSVKFGFHVPDNVNPFVDDRRHCLRRVGESIDFICEMLAGATL